MDTTSLHILEGTVSPDTGLAPDRRFIDPKDRANGSWAHAQIKHFCMSGNTKDFERSTVEAMLRFAPPYSDEDLRALNLENMPNSTMGELPRRVGEDESKWTDYTVSSNGLWKVNFPDLPGEVSDTISEQVSELINTLWMDDPRHVVMLQLAFRQFSCWGIGPVVWVDCYDPTPVARVASDLKFPPRTRITLDNFTECSMKDTVTPQDLFATIRGKVGETRAKMHGWNRTEVTKVLKHNARNDGISNNTWDNLERAELAERQGFDLWGDYAGKEIGLIHVLVREFEPDEEGKILSHLVLAETGDGWRIIRDKGYAYTHPREFMVLATDRVGSDATIAGLRGMAVDLMEHARSMDVLHNSGMYAAFRNSTPIYATTGGAGANSADQISVRPNGVVIPMGFTEVQPHTDFQASGWQIDRLSNLADRYQRIYDINAPNKGGVQRTAREATFDAAKESDARSNQILPIERLFFEPLGREFLRRLFFFPKNAQGKCLKYRGWEIAQSFWDQLDRVLSENGVPLIALKNHRVVSNPNNSPGGLDKKLMRFNASLPLYGMLQTQAQKNWLTNNGLIAIHGYQASKPYLNQNEALPSSDRVASLDGENADLESGYQRRVLPDQDHLAHLGPLVPEGVGHVPYAMQMMKRMTEGTFRQFVTDPVEELGDQLRGLVTIHGHIQAHLALMSQNPLVLEMPEVQGYFDFQATLEQGITAATAQFNQMAAEKAPDQDPEMAKTAAEIRRKDAMAAAEIERTNQKHNVKLGNQVQTMQMRHDEKQSSHILDEVIKQKKAQTDLAAQTAGEVIDLKAQETKNELQVEAAKASAKEAKKSE